MKRQLREPTPIASPILTAHVARLQRRVGELTPIAGAMLRAQLTRLGSLVWALAQRRLARAVAGYPLLVLSLAGAGVPWWVIKLASGGGAVVVGFWLLVLWWLRRLQAPLAGFEPAPAKQSSGGARPRSNRQTKGATATAARRRK